MAEAQRLMELDWLEGEFFDRFGLYLSSATAKSIC